MGALEVGCRWLSLVSRFFYLVAAIFLFVVPTRWLAADDASVPEKAEKRLAEIESHGGKGYFVPVDVTSREALQKMEDYKPDLVFLDIQMPDLNGFDVLAKSDK